MEIIEYQPHFYILDDGQVREFLIIGESRALLIDTGFPNNHINEEVRKLTSKRIDVLLTHGDKDHCGNLFAFSRCYMHENDRCMIKEQISINYLDDSDEISIAGYCFHVIHIPGHTSGSIALLDKNKKLLLPGDSVQTGPIYMFGKHRNLDDYIDSLKKLKRMQRHINTIIPSHHQYPLNAEYISYCLDDALLLKEGKLQGISHPSLPCYEYQGEHIKFYYDK